jgi:hypothetical protein
MPPGTNRRPGRVVRPASRAIGKPMASPSAAAAVLTHSEFVMATAPGGLERRHQRTMVPSNQVLMVASLVPQVYGSMVWVLTPASEGSAGSGLTPWSTG